MTNNIDTIFKKKAGDIPVDTGMMDTDWEAMKMLLAPVVPPAVKPAGNILIKKIFFAVVITAAVVVAVYLLLKKQPTIKTASLAVNAKTGIKQPPAITQHTAGDTIMMKSTPIKLNNQAAHININRLQDSALRKPTARVLFDTATNNKSRQHQIMLTVKPLIDTPKQIVMVLDSTGLKLPVTIIKIKSDKEILDSFYNLLKTPTQLFAIDNTRDTTIIGKDSSEIIIPANCFVDSAGHLVNKNVVIQLDECYSYADIVARKLYTVSDGSLLESGGMLQIKAIAKNKSLALNKSKQLLVKMPVKKLDNNMQLFLPQQRKPVSTAKKPGEIKTASNGIEGWLPERDTALPYDAMPGINWVQAGQQQFYDKGIWVTVLNLQNEPFATATRSGKNIGKFRVIKKCTLTKEQIIAELMKRYNYDEVRIRWYNYNTFYTDYINTWNTTGVKWQYRPGKIYIGDSVNIPAGEAERCKLWAPGQKEAYLKKLRKNSVYWQAVANLENKYAFDISTLGWINCDHFYNSSRPLLRYVININDQAQNYVSQVIFIKSRLAMAAQVTGNYISFPNLPEGEPVQIVSIGVKNGKVVACVKNASVSKEIVSDLQYEEVTVDRLKKQLQASDMK